MRRREVITLLGGAAATWPLAVHAQQPTPVVGYISTGSVESDIQSGSLPAFWKGLSEAGYFEGRNIAVKFYGAEGRFDRIPTQIDDLIRQRVTVIFVRSLPGAQAARAATTTIPVVFSIGED